MCSERRAEGAAVAGMEARTWVGPFPQDQQEAAKEFTCMVRDQMSLRKASVSPCLGRVWMGG